MYMKFQPTPRSTSAHQKLATSCPDRPTATHTSCAATPAPITCSTPKRLMSEPVTNDGANIATTCAAITVAVANFWWALVLLGVGWNFMYIGGTTLLTETYRPAEKAKTQGFNEMAIFTVQALSAFSSGVLVNTRGWEVLNYVALPFILAAGASLAWLGIRRARI